MKPIQDQLRHPQIADGDIFQWENEPYLTFGGLARLAYHVINNFIWRQNTLDVEDYDSAKDLPSVVMMNLAPEYWIGKYENFIPSHATKKLSGFLTNIQAARVSGKPIVDFKKLLKKYESYIPSTKKKYKIPMLAAYCLFNLSIREEERMPNYREFLEQYEDILGKCSIEMIIVYLLLNEKLPWNVEDCVSQYNIYKQSKFSKNSLEVPQLIDIALLVEIANMYLRVGETDKYDEWLQIACFESPGKPKIQELVSEFRSQRREISANLILAPSTTT